MSKIQVYLVIDYLLKKKAEVGLVQSNENSKVGISQQFYDVQVGVHLQFNENILNTENV